jgi:L-rhamnose isomerase
MEIAGDYTARLAMLEQLKSLPASAVWDQFCLQLSAPLERDWLSIIRDYEKTILSKRA